MTLLAQTFSIAFDALAPCKRVVLIRRIGSGLITIGLHTLTPLPLEKFQIICYSPNNV